MNRRRMIAIGGGILAPFAVVALVVAGFCQGMEWLRNPAETLVH